ncbi:MAG TPA: efflux RND transporter periplasmic adaptor subunit [Candidatus Elarobacter sp.]|nr:efflux RND transporter periplasmic adaptor subunit [Candidatus Elarobacter sp.]
MLALTLLAAACGEAPERKPDPPAPSAEVRFDPGSPRLAYIAVEPVRARTDKVVAVLPAQVVMDEDHTVRIASPVTGRITQLVAHPGDRVSRNQPVAYITSGDAAQASSDMIRARAAATLAATALRRAEDLYAHHVIAQKDVEQARSDEAQARAELARASARATQLGTSGATGGTFVLRSPIAGEIVDRTANPGAEVRPDASAPLFTVSDLDVVWLTAAAYQRDLATVQRGQQLVFTTDATPGRKFVGTVSYVSDVLDPQTRTLTLRAVLPNGDHRLRPQTFGEARLLAPQSDGVPAVPTAALVTHGASTVVFVERAPGHYARREVVVGDDDGTTATIVSGLRIGERVVTRGSILLAGEVDGGTQ